MPPATASSFVNSSPSNFLVLLVLAVIWAVVGFRLAEHDRHRLDRQPWGVPSRAWALLWFLGGIVTAAVYLVARGREVQRSRTAGILRPVRPTPGMRSGPTAPPVSAADLFPAYPRPANDLPAPPTLGHPVGGPLLAAADPAANQGAAHQGATDQGAADQGAGAATRPGGGTDASASSASAAEPAPSPEISPPHWHPDPSGRFHYRWWNGSEWTSTVSIDGQVLVDTSPDQRIGPYS